MINGIIIVALIVVAIFAVKGSIRQFTYGCCGTKDVEKKIKVQDKNASDYPYYAVIGDGMKCKHCKLHVENAFNEKDGNWAEVNLEKKKADVRMKTKLTDREIRDIVSKAGYVLRNIEWKQA
jgi:copper chaperone